MPRADLLGGRWRITRVADRLVVLLDRREERVGTSGSYPVASIQCSELTATMASNGELLSGERGELRTKLDGDDAKAALGERERGLAGTAPDLENSGARCLASADELQLSPPVSWNDGV
jgi:hypothetical protein